MTDPEQVSVNVADLRGVASVSVLDLNAVERRCLENLLSNIPELEWEPTDDMRAGFRKVFGHLGTGPEGGELSSTWIDNCLRALHREGLIS